MIRFDTILQDLRYGARALRHSARFTAVSTLALALGIGVNTAVFTAYKALIGRPLEGRDPGTLANFSLRLGSGASQARFSSRDYEAYRDGLRSFSGVIAFSIESLTLSDAGGAAVRRRDDAGSLMGRLGLVRPSVTSKEVVSAFVVSENYFSVLGVPPVRGRAFDAIGPAELVASPSVLISENYWQRRFAGDPGVVGKSIRLNGAAFTIAGVTPANFTGTGVAVPNFWFPLSLYPLAHPDSSRLRDREDLCCRVFGRLAPGVTMTEAQAEATLLASQLREQHEPRSDLAKELSAVISPGSPLPPVNASLKLTIALIMSAAGMVLVIACANAAGLQLARATARQQELAMRLSLGATRLRLVRQLVTESALQGVLAGCVALPVTWMLMHLGMTKFAEQMPPEVTLLLDVSPDARVFTYVLSISAIAGVLFGLVPAISSSRSALFSITRTGTSAARSRLRHGLIAAQVAVSLTLVIAGSLLVRSAIQALTLDAGYDGERVVALDLQFPEGRTAEAKAALVRDLRTRLAALPGVTAVTSARAPSDQHWRRAAVSLNNAPPSPGNIHATVFYTWVEPNYFDTLGVSLSFGRGFREGQQERAVILSESAARRLWPGQNPLGRRLRLGAEGLSRSRDELTPDGVSWEVIGVARDTRGIAIDRSDSQQIYVPLPADRLQDHPILVRTSTDPALVMRAMEPMITADPELTASISTVQAMLRQGYAFMAASTAAAIASTIGLFGLLLASLGIYSTVSYDVVLRTRELGIRIAIGAQKRNVLIVVLRGTLRPMLGGLALGVVLSFAASYLLRGVLYGLSAIDVVSFAGGPLLFLTIALAASWLPARRAMRVDPLVALRYE